VLFAVLLNRNRSSTTSVRSEAYDMVQEFGRTYHGYKAGKYILPNDEVPRNVSKFRRTTESLTVCRKSEID
jgi:hypothetical protein